MKRLFFSIIIAVFGSLFLISWGLDFLVAQHESSMQTSNSQESNHTQIYQQLLTGLITQLNESQADNLTKKTSLLAQQFQLTLNLEQSKNIALPELLETQLSSKQGLLLASNEQAYLLKRIPHHPNYLIRLQLPKEEKDDNSVNIILTATLYLGVSLVLILWLFPLAKRVFDLTNAAARIGKGELDVRVSKSRFSYISSLENSFNHMARKIETLMADNKLLASSLSHDIRTPMSCLRFGVEAALDSKDINKKNTYLIRMENELTKMEEMTSAFLSYAGMERQGIHLKPKPVALAQLLENITKDFQNLAKQKNINLSCQITNKVNDCLIDKHWFYQALHNLISNAIQYAQAHVTITLSQENKHIYISVADDGKGIAKEKLSLIFDPFVKLDSERSREQGHFGLGLAICAKVIEWHKGSIKAQASKQLGGAEFVIQLNT